LINHQEHEAWDVLLACQGQLRLAPSEHVVGIEMAAALKIGAARCYNLAVVSELLPAAEAGLVEALRVDADRPIEALIAPTNVRSSSHCGPLRYAAHPSESDPIRTIAPREDVVPHGPWVVFQLTLVAVRPVRRDPAPDRTLCGRGCRRSRHKDRER
jgi:hypothetical protein